MYCRWTRGLRRESAVTRLLVLRVRIPPGTWMFFGRNTNKTQLCNRIYYPKVYWSLNMFRAAHRSSSGALNCICSSWFICPCGDRPLSRLGGKWIHFPLSLGNGRSPHGYTNIYSLELLMMSGVPLETCWAFNKLWNNKFYYKAASCWYFYWVLYDARIHEYQTYECFSLVSVTCRQVEVSASGWWLV